MTGETPLPADYETNERPCRHCGYSLSACFGWRGQSNPKCCAACDHDAASSTSPLPGVSPLAAGLRQAVLRAPTAPSPADDTRHRVRKLATQPRVRLVTDGDRWSVDVWRRSWLRLGAFAWRREEFGYNLKRWTCNEIEARDRYEAVCARLSAGKSTWRTVESSELSTVMSR